MTLAAAIRKVTENETFDFAGANLETIRQTVHDAFGDPFESGIVRITLITGAGKLGRSKYDDNAAKTVTQTLLELGFVEDRGASAIIECAGSFKLQHDTGKNLKTVVVFPKVSGTSTGGGAAAEGSAEHNETASTSPYHLASDSISAKLAFSSLPVFEKMLVAQCATWSQRKACLAELSELKQKVELLDTKLQTGQLLDEPEQAYYDSVTSLDEKMAFCKTSMHEMVETGHITETEKQQLLNQVQEKIQQHKNDNKAKLLEKSRARQEKLLDTSTIPPPPLKHHAALSKLHKELAPILQMEASMKGKALLSLKETQQLTRKDEILQEMEELEASSRGWFESDEMFQDRLKIARAGWKTNSKAPKKKTATTTTTAAATKKGGSAIPSTTSWVTSGGAAKKGGGAWSSQPKKKASPAAGGGNLFAAMMQDSDSD